VGVTFSHGLPALHNRLETGSTVMEVVSHLSETVVRCVALTATRGLRRGQEVIDSGSPLEVPVGSELLGRMLTVLGKPIDGGEPLPDRRRSIHQPPVPLSGHVPLRTF